MHVTRPVRLLLGTTVAFVTVAAVAASTPATPAAPVAQDTLVEAGALESPAPPPVDTTAAAPGPVVVRGVGVERSMTHTALRHLDIPAQAMFAYRTAASVVRKVDHDCGLSWTLLAAIGRVESDHGRTGGADLAADGVSTPLIRGSALNGSGPVARVADTDAGTVDGDHRWDRAVGPMQFLPATWSAVGVDADGDGVRSADDLDDAALGAAVYLCAAPGNLTSRRGLHTAIHRYNPSTAYVSDVLATERAYRTGDFDLLGSSAYAGPPAVVDAVDTQAVVPARAAGASGHGGRHHHAGAQHADHHAHHHAGHHGEHGEHGQQSDDVRAHAAHADLGAAHDHGHHGTGTGPQSPDPTPDPSPTPTPEPPTTQTLDGTLTACGTDDEPAWCLDETVLDVGDADYLAATALADFDGDGATETNADELAGLAGAEVSLETTVPSDAGEAPVVLTIDDVTYREPDQPDEPGSGETGS